MQTYTEDVQSLGKFWLPPRPQYPELSRKKQNKQTKKKKKKKKKQKKKKQINFRQSLVATSLGVNTNLT